MGKKIFVPCLDVILIAFFSEKYTVKDYISETAEGEELVGL